jgi:HTH-type transcriptional regulator / antitoxin HigA
MLETRTIKTEAEYQAALVEIDNLLDAEPNTPECDRLEELTTLLDLYEKEHYPIEAPEPIEAILYYLEARGLSWSYLEPFIGSSEEVADILNRKKPLTLEIIRCLYQQLGISAEVLIQPYSLKD